ncbi:hypothetical protein GUJ93_ZPchr0004g38315 [Zizania palustris]|uniref:Uncharacterized protein n=1 Tax=Zizania palustris TaxID=103762 RepID=A0A8J5SJQ9_ZIZPA|nr:hypothetical protein GUJ93_ZPchr0004g38315 [Zizania palustris]
MAPLPTTGNKEGLLACNQEEGTIEPTTTTRMTQTHLVATEREDGLGYDTSALGEGSPDLPDGGAGGLGRARSGGDDSIGDVNSAVEASATSLIT